MILGKKSVVFALLTIMGPLAHPQDEPMKPIDANTKWVRAVVLENDLMRMWLSAGGVLEELVSKKTGKSYAPPGAGLPIFRVGRMGRELQASAVRRQGDLIQVDFGGPEVNVTIKVAERKHYIAFEVANVEPADVEWFSMEFPVKALKTRAWAMNGTHDDEFGICHMGLTPNTLCTPVGHGPGVVSLQAQCFLRHGIKGAKTALIASPFDQYLSVIQEMEKDTGLPCPILDGKWARISEPVRRSYLFAIGVAADDVDALIEYAKIGHFGLIKFLRFSWNKTCGHYEINEKNFPGGREGLKRACDKIHAAGLKVGIHLFGPAISQNDPYITPIPDERLMYVECSPLAEAIDDKATVLTLTGQADLPPRQKKSSDPLGTFPGYFIRMGDEVIRYSDIEVGPPYRFTGCKRGALGTRAAAHPAGAPVRSFVLMWETFMFDPDSTLLDEAAQNLADIVNYCKIDMVYFDGSGCIPTCHHFDLWYYMNKSLLTHYRRFDHDVLFQTSMSTGQQLWWHMIPRSASADGHGDIKAYLDQRLDGILRMKDNFTAPDIGWYGLDPGWPPDYLEYICAKCLGCDGSISVQANRKILETHPRARETMEMIGRYERCRLANHFPEPIKAKLREKGKEFKLLEEAKGRWKLLRAAYEPERTIAAMDNVSNVWTVRNDLDHPCVGAVEIWRDRSAGYNDAGALVIEDFEDLSVYPGGSAREGVSQTFLASAQDVRSGKSCAVFAAKNEEEYDGWAARGRRFPKPIDLSGYEALALWVDGDGMGELLRIHFYDRAGHYQDFLVPVKFKGWRLQTFVIPRSSPFNWNEVDRIIFLYWHIPAKKTVSARLDGLRAIPKLSKAPILSHPTLTVNDKQVRIPVDLDPGKWLTTDGLGGCTLWPGGMAPGQKVAAPDATFTLNPGGNSLKFSCDNPGDFLGDVTVRVIRLLPLEE